MKLKRKFIRFRNNNRRKFYLIEATLITIICGILYQSFNFIGFIYIGYSLYFITKTKGWF